LTSTIIHLRDKLILYGKIRYFMTFTS